MEYLPALECVYPCEELTVNFVLAYWEIRTSTRQKQGTKLEVGRIHGPSLEVVGGCMPFPRAQDCAVYKQE